MIPQILDTVFGEIVECMLDSVELGIYETESKFDFCFEKYGYTITGRGRVGGDWIDNGNDGWNDPIDYYLKNGWGYIDELEVLYTDTLTEEETCFDEDVVRELQKRLESDLKDYMNDY